MRLDHRPNPSYLTDQHKRYADICDRCGCEINRTVDEYPAKWISNYGCHNTRSIGLGIFFKGSKHALELCNNCAKELTEWMNHS
jgi:hypothetical protein